MMMYTQHPRQPRSVLVLTTNRHKCFQPTTPSRPSPCKTFWADDSASDFCSSAFGGREFSLLTHRAVERGQTTIWQMPVCVCVYLRLVTPIYSMHNAMGIPRPKKSWMTCLCSCVITLLQGDKSQICLFVVYIFPPFVETWKRKFCICSLNK